MRCEVPRPPCRCGPSRRGTASTQTTPPHFRWGARKRSRGAGRARPTQTRAVSSPRPGRAKRVEPRRVPGAARCAPPSDPPAPAPPPPTRGNHGTRRRVTAAALEPGHVLPCMRVYRAAATRRMRTVAAAAAGATAARSSERRRRRHAPPAQLPRPERAPRYLRPRVRWQLPPRRPPPLPWIQTRNPLWAPTPPPRVARAGPLCK